jgi:hypothetical protein
MVAVLAQRRAFEFLQLAGPDPEFGCLGDSDASAFGRMHAAGDFGLRSHQPSSRRFLRRVRLDVPFAVLVEIISDPGGFRLSSGFPRPLADRCHRKPYPAFVSDFGSYVAKLSYSQRHKWSARDRGGALRNTKTTIDIRRHRGYFLWCRWRGFDPVEALSKEPEIRYKHVEEVLSRIFKVPPERAGAFRAHLRHLRNIGLPKLPTPGSGKQIGYTRDQLVETLIALELSALGISPKRILEALTEQALLAEPKLPKSPGWQHWRELLTPRQTEMLAAGEGIELPNPQYPSGRLIRLAKRLEGYSVFLIVYPGTEFGSGEGYKIEIKELQKEDIKELVGKHQRISLVNLSNSFEVLDKYIDALD